MCPVFALLGTPTTLLILGAVAALLFGERLPEVVRTLGKGLWEVKNGVRGIQEEIEDAVKSAVSVEPPSRRQKPEDRGEAPPPKVEPPP